MNYDDFFADALARLRSERRYRVFAISSESPAASRAPFGIRRRARRIS
jgi:hypothetical protein